MLKDFLFSRSSSGDSENDEYDEDNPSNSLIVDQKYHVLTDYFSSKRKIFLKVWNAKRFNIGLHGF